MEIRENVATKKFRMVFHNPNSAPNAEATFFMDLEPDQKVDRFAVKIGGKAAEGEILDQEKARKIYEEIVRKKKDPALLEYYGSKLLRVRIFPLPPRSDFEVEIETIEPLRAQDGIVRVQTLNASPSSFQKPIRRVSIDATISSSRAVKSVFSPTHAVNVARKDAHEARLTYEKRDYVANGPFTFYYTLGDDELGATLIATPDGEDGAFMLTLTPPSEVKWEDQPARNILYLLDTSGSMNEEGKIDQARAALKKFVATLTDKDRFDIVTFGTEAQKYSGKAPHATEKARADAIAWIDTIRARGGTNIEEAFKEAQDIYLRGGTTSIVLISDGMPTIGERDPKKLVALAKALHGRVFCFGVGTDVQSQLLDRLAIETGGDRQYVAPKEELALVVENFARRVGTPVLVNPTLTFEGNVTEIHPKRLPDLFRGGELTVYGRFRGVPPSKVHLTGWENGRELRRTYDLAATPDPRHAFVARLWAIQKIDFLIDEIRERGASKELVDHIVEVAKRYGIVTPYTSSLMTEDTPTAQVVNQLKASQAAKFTGQEDNQRVGNQMAWRNAGNHEAQLYACNGALGRGTDAKAIAQTLQEQRLVCNRAFGNGKAGWSEATFAAQKVQSIRFGSDEYFQFVRENPETAPILALGNNVTFQHRNNWYRIEA
jgi:Ca-activated chloride channel family protein